MLIHRKLWNNFKNTTFFEFTIIFPVKKGWKTNLKIFNYFIHVNVNFFDSPNIGKIW